MSKVIRTSLSDDVLGGLDKFANTYKIPRGEAVDILVKIALTQKEKEANEIKMREIAVARKDRLLNRR